MRPTDDSLLSGCGQGRSGLGLEAQRAALARFAGAEGFELVAEFIEVETGEGADALERRPQLSPRLDAASGVTSHRGIARVLNTRGTARGGRGRPCRSAR